MDIIILIINISVAIYCFISWQKTKDRDLFLISLLGLLVVVLVAIKLILSMTGVVSPGWITTVLHYSWLVIIIAVGMILFKTSKR